MPTGLILTALLLSSWVFCIYFGSALEHGRNRIRNIPKPKQLLLYAPLLKDVTDTVAHYANQLHAHTQERFDAQDAKIALLQDHIHTPTQQRTPGDYIDLAFAEMVHQVTQQIDEKFAELNNTTVVTEQENEPVKSAHLIPLRSDTISGGKYDNRIRKMRISKRSVAEIADALGISKRAVENRITILKKARKL